MRSVEILAFYFNKQSGAVRQLAARINYRGEHVVGTPVGFHFRRDSR